MANGGRLSYLNGVEGEHPTVQLVIADMLEGLPVPGINEYLPMWNSYTTFTKFLVAIFGFSESQPDDDGTLILIHPIGLQSHLRSHLKRANMKVQCNWTCVQPSPLTHPLYPGSMVCLESKVRHDTYLVLRFFDILIMGSG